MKLQRSALCFIAIIGILSTLAHSIRFEIESGHTKCIAEDIKSNSMIVGHYSIVTWISRNHSQSQFNYQYFNLILLFISSL
ncbi:hypothetical protein Hanom_Chr12g01114151 [Helianthus anomalus]